MICEVRTIRRFRKEAKRLIKKYPSLKHELAVLESELTHDPKTGTPLGKNCFKVRVAIKSKGKGKSGGARIISHLIVFAQIPSHSRLYLLTIYDKSEYSTIEKKDIEQMLYEISLED